MNTSRPTTVNVEVIIRDQLLSLVVSNRRSGRRAVGGVASGGRGPAEALLDVVLDDAVELLRDALARGEVKEFARIIAPLSEIYREVTA